MGTRRCLAEYSISIFFQMASWYWVVQDISSSELISVPFSNYLNDRNFWRGSRTGAEMCSMPVVGITSGKYLDSICRANFTAKIESSSHWVFSLATAHITPSMWLNMSLYTVIMWCNVTVCLFDIHRIQYCSRLNTSMTYFTIVHSSWVVNSGRYSVN
jgi:hypothetical protein